MSIPRRLRQLRQRSAGVAPINTIVIEGDSITSTTPSTYASSFFSYRYSDYQSAKTIHVRAQGSRVVGAIGLLNDNSNSMVGNVSEDLAYGPQLVTTMIGSNDLGSSTAATYKTNLVDYNAALKAASPATKFAWSAPPPYNSSGTPHPDYTIFTSRRATLLTDCRDPAVWGTWCDYYIPMGEHPDFNDAALVPTLYGDSVHLTGYDTPSAGAGGQNRLYDVYKAAVDTILDASRVSATTPYEAVWPVSETSLAISTVITRRFILSGMAPASPFDMSLTGAGTMQRNGGGYGASLTQCYNGDVIDVKATTSASSLTAVTYDLTIGSETRQISLTTVVNVPDVTFTLSGVYTKAAFATSFTQSVTLPVGETLIAIAHATVSGVTVGGNAATLIGTQGGLTLYVYSNSNTSAQNVVASYSSADAVVMAIGTMIGADPTYTQFVSNAPASESDPHLTPAITVPSHGLAMGYFRESGGASITPGTANNGTFVAEGNVTNLGSTFGILAAKYSTSLTPSFNFAFGSFQRMAVVFKAAGT